MMEAAVVSCLPACLPFQPVQHPEEERLQAVIAQARLAEETAYKKRDYAAAGRAADMADAAEKELEDFKNELERLKEEARQRELQQATLLRTQTGAAAAGGGLLPLPTPQAVHVCSVSGRWPGGSSSARRAATLLKASGDAVTSVPAKRWVLEDEVDVSALTKLQLGVVSYSSFVGGAQLFDPLAFGMSVSESEATDPTQRMLLEHGYIALHATHQRRISMLDSAGTCESFGVTMGIERSDWDQLMPPSAYAIGATNSVASGRLSFVLGLQGPCWTGATRLTPPDFPP